MDGFGSSVGCCRSKQGSATLDAYLSQKHDKLLAKLLQPDTYWKKSSLAIVDGFAVEITDAQVTARPHLTPIFYCRYTNLLLHND